MEDQQRLIEVAFPLKQASLDSVHEKNVRHGHISTLHIWPARRPLAACRAALIATLLPDPGTQQARKELLEKIGGKVITEVQKKKVGGKTVEVVKERTEGGVLRWGNENSPDMDWFREEIKKAYGGQAPKVLDPFAGGGAIPLEAMRLGCEATAIDINPVAWFLLKCTLEYPQKLAGQTRPLPKFALESGEFMQAFLRGTGKLAKTQVEKELAMYQRGLFPPPEADLAWHVRAWGWWVLQQARKDLERFYPRIDGKPTVAYLWARTVMCKNCRATIPLLKSAWLSKRDKNRAVITIQPNAEKTGVVFGVREGVPIVGGNASQSRDYDKRIGSGTMTRSGATCPCCNQIMTWEDLRLEGRSQRFGSAMTVVVVEGQSGKEYRPPTPSELEAASDSVGYLDSVFAQVPFGLPSEPTPGPSGARLDGSTLLIWGFLQWRDLFSPRQLLSLGVFVCKIRDTLNELESGNYPKDWAHAIQTYLGIMLDRAASYMSSRCYWVAEGTEVKQTFARFAFPIIWDYAEANPLSSSDRYFSGAISNVSRVLAELLPVGSYSSSCRVLNRSAIRDHDTLYDIIITDPPYYDAIPYSNLMDFFYIWLRRTFFNLSSEFDDAFRNSLSPKWDQDRQDGELVDDCSRHDKNRLISKRVYEDGMARAFASCFRSLKDDGRMVVVFANKKPDAWETLVSAMIRSGFVVTANWPIVTEMRGGVRNIGRASLSSSVWLVCKKRLETTRPGWDNRVLDEMRHNIHTRLRDYWDAGIRGPDFVWAATGPAMESYSKHPVVKKANAPGKLMEVAEFLRAVRRLVVDFVVGRVLTGDGDESTASGLDDITTYYILHRHDFGMDDAPIGACILYAVSCNLSDNDLTNRYEVLLRTGGLAAAAAEDEDAEDREVADEDTDPNEGTGSTVKIRAWHQRKRKTMGYDTEGHPAPLIDQVHRLMHLWKAGDVVKVDDYLDARGLRKHALFLQLLQALIELAGEGTEERVILENISNHLAARGVSPVRTASLPGMLSTEHDTDG